MLLRKIVFFLLIVSCSQVLGMKLEVERWKYAVEITPLRHFSLAGPLDIWLDVLRLNFSTKNHQMFSQCVFLRKRDSFFDFKVMTVQTDQGCLLQQERESALYQNFRSVDLKKIKKGFEITLVDQKSRLTRFQIELLNHKSKVFYYLPTHLEPSSDLMTKNLSSLLDDKVKCRQVDPESCEVIYDNCKRCRTSWYEVLNGCKNGGERYCGEDHCGEKNQPSCGVGFFRVRSRSQRVDCRVNQDFGICQDGLTKECLNGELWCR